MVECTGFWVRKKGWLRSAQPTREWTSYEGPGKRDAVDVDGSGVLAVGKRFTPLWVDERNGGRWQCDVIDRDEVRHVGETELLTEPAEQLIEELLRGELTPRHFAEGIGIPRHVLDVDQWPVGAALGLAVEVDHGSLESLPFLGTERAFEHDYAQVDCVEVEGGAPCDWWEERCHFRMPCMVVAPFCRYIVVRGLENFRSIDIIVHKVKYKKMFAACRTCNTAGVSRDGTWSGSVCPTRYFIDRLTVIGVDEVQGPIVTQMT